MSKGSLDMHATIGWEIGDHPCMMCIFVLPADDAPPPPFDCDTV